MWYWSVPLLTGSVATVSEAKLAIKYVMQDGFSIPIIYNTAQIKAGDFLFMKVPEAAAKAPAAAPKAKAPAAAPKAARGTNSYKRKLADM